MQPSEYLESLRRDVDGFVAAVRRGTDAVVPGCPDWKVADLARHMGGVHRWATAIVADRPSPPQSLPDAPADDAALASWVAEGADTLAATLTAAGQGDDCWTFSPHDRTVGFWFRRQANETGIHRWDAESAHDGIDGAPPVDADIAADGIDEYLGTFVARVRSRLADRADAGAGETFHFHRTDGPGEWFVAFPHDGEVVVTREHAKGDVAIRGSASDLILWLWRRVPDARLDAVGDLSRVTRWRELVPAT
jgi:uncharacterized protein (TIGR03083 family)